MQPPQQPQIERVYDLLETRGPASAYAYMEQAGGTSSFPKALVMLVRGQLMAHQRSYPSQAADRSRASVSAPQRQR